jgi:hypothetical protein
MSWLFESAVYCWNKNQNVHRGGAPGPSLGNPELDQRFIQLLFPIEVGQLIICLNKVLCQQHLLPAIAWEVPNQNVTCSIVT